MADNEGLQREITIEKARKILGKNGVLMEKKKIESFWIICICV
ncbi:hypothetical protein [Sphingobacterium sp. UBA5670]|nr:hypothetical protein [Sphingobacterium sp. UBA5670]